MNAKLYTFKLPLRIPAVPSGPDDTYLDAVERDEEYELQWRALNAWPGVIQMSTGDRGRIVRSLISDIRELPEFGKVTLTFEQFLILEGSSFREWESDDWQLTEAS
jgi:hypothetical protein